MKIGNVLSLFDGMSCAQIALNRLGIKYDNYYASKIKKHAIKCCLDNYPNTIQLGDIRNVSAYNLPKIDIVFAGSPCQDFSMANKERKGLEGIKSGLFYEFLRILKECQQINPDVKFLLENVAMDDISYQTISHLVGTFPVDINSSLVSAQMRQRSYWTNIGPGYEDMFGMRYCSIPQPKDKKISLQSILTSGYVDRYKSRAILESESRPLATHSKMFHRYSDTGFTTIVFESPDYNYLKGIRYFNQTELETLQTVTKDYTKSLSRNDAACLLGDGWTIDVIVHLLSFLA